jgi:hypothetical protein
VIDGDDDETSMDGADLDAAIAALATALAPRLVAEARAEAVAEVRDRLTGRLTAEMVRRCEAELELGYYVYGVVRAGVPLPGDLAGVEPSTPVRLLESGGLAALVSEVPSAEFEEASLRRNLDDVAWLEEMALAHEQVLERLLAETAVIPLRLGSVLTGEEQVREMLGRDRDALLGALGRLSRRAEWGVRAFGPRGAMASEAPRREIHDKLAAVADEALLNPLQAVDPGGHPGGMFLSGVYLIADEEASDFRSVARELAERFDRRGIEIVLTGPWPAYNFVKTSIEAAR